MAPIIKYNDTDIKVGIIDTATTLNNLDKEIKNVEKRTNESFNLVYDEICYIIEKNRKLKLCIIIQGFFIIAILVHIILSYL